MQSFVGISANLPFEFMSSFLKRKWCIVVGAGSEQGSKGEGAGSRREGAGSTREGAGSSRFFLEIDGFSQKLLMDGAREQGGGSREQGGGSRETEGGSRERGPPCPPLLIRRTFTERSPFIVPSAPLGDIENIMFTLNILQQSLTWNTAYVKPPTIKYITP